MTKRAPPVQPTLPRAADESGKEIEMEYLILLASYGLIALAFTITIGRIA